MIRMINEMSGDDDHTTSFNLSVNKLTVPLSHMTIVLAFFIFFEA